MYKVFFKGAALLVILSNSSLNAMEKFASGGKPNDPYQSKFDEESKFRSNKFRANCPDADRMNLTFDPRNRFYGSQEDAFEVGGGALNIFVDPRELSSSRRWQWFVYVVENNAGLSFESGGSKFELQNEEKNYVKGVTLPILKCTYKLTHPTEQDRALVISNFRVEVQTEEEIAVQNREKKNMYQKAKDKAKDIFK